MAKTKKSNGKVTVSKTKKSNGRITDNMMREVVHNALLSRTAYINKFLDRRRSIDDEAGYPKTHELDIEEYQQLYDRESVAARVVEVLPKEAWNIQPSVFETEDIDQDTEFEIAWHNLGHSLSPVSWLSGENDNPIWEILERVDILSGIGSYGVLLLGLNDGQDMLEPAENKSFSSVSEESELGENNNSRLLFVRAFGESLVKISKFVDDPSNPRFGQPETYGITFSDPREDQRSGSTSKPSGTREVHWSRVIHIADNLSSSEVFGIPRMRPVYNRLYDLKKLYGGSAEMYWKGAFQGLSFESHPQLGGDITLTSSDRQKMKDEFEQYQNGLQRAMFTTGMEVKSLAPQVVDPTPQIDTQLEAICIKIGIPKRIFTGSERGELASSQDIVTWNSRVAGRQNHYLTPRVIAPFIDRCIGLGILPEPKEGYNVVWPDLGASTELEQSMIALQKTDAMGKYIQGGVESLIQPLDYLTRILGMTEDEATEVVDAAVEAIDEQIAEGVVEDPAETVRMDAEMKEAELKTAKQPKEPIVVKG